MTDYPAADDPRSLERFLAAQEMAFETALAELRRGRKESHWMWFIFPQLRGLGRSGTAHFFGVADLAEAQAYADHPILGPRLVTAAEAVLSHPGTPIETIMGPVDGQKLRSTATLFAAVEGAPDVFHRLLGQFYGGEPCARTLAMLGR